MKTISVCDVSKHYRDVRALQEVTLELQAGKIYGLLGRNGAGKSTLLKIIAGRITPTSGQVLYDGKSKPDDATSRELYFSEPEKTFPESLKIKDLCYHTSQFYPRFNLAEAQHTLQNFGIDTNKRLSHLSTGEFAIVRSIVALHTRARFIFLDEPTLGHDAVSRELFYSEVLRIYQEEENTIVLSTHLIEEISNLLEEAIFIQHGRIFLQENTEALLTRHAYISCPTEQMQHIDGAYTVISKKEEIGFTTVLVEMPDKAPRVASDIKISKAGLQDIFIAYSKQQDK